MDIETRDIAYFDDPVEISEAIKIAKDDDRKLALSLKLAEYEPEESRLLVKALDPSAVDTQESIKLKFGEDSFPPIVAYPIFPADFIRGYESPELTLEYDPVTLLCNVEFEFEKQVTEGIEPPTETLKNFLPSDTLYGEHSKWEQQKSKDAEEFKSLFSSKPIMSYDNYEVYEFSFQDPLQAQFLSRISVFSLFFIEGAQMFNKDDYIWKYYVIVEKSTHRFVGYVTTYTFLYYVTGEQYDLAGGPTYRKRISQFVVMPQYQNKKIGKNVYLKFLEMYRNDKTVKEIDVEDPTAEFELLRDRAHYNLITEDQKSLELIQLYSDKPGRVLKELFSIYKLPYIHFKRVAEMYFIENSESKSQFNMLTRLIKTRLWEQNYTALKTMDRSELRMKLQEACDNVIHTHKVALHLVSEEDDDEEEDGQDDEMAALEELRAAENERSVSGSKRVKR